MFHFGVPDRRRVPVDSVTSLRVPSTLATRGSVRTTFTVWCVGAFLLVGCGGNQPGQVPGPTSGLPYGGTPTGSPYTGAPTGNPGGTPTGTNTGGTPCESAPPLPGTWTLMTNVPESEEFTFDDQGYLLNISDASNLLYRTTRFGVAETLVPYSSPEIGGIRFVPGGDKLVVADEGNGALKSLTLAGQTEVLLGAVVEPNSLAIHSDGWIYTTAADQIWRVDPDGLQAPILQFTLPGYDLDGLVLSNDESTLYFNHDEDGLVFEATVGIDGELGTPQQIANLDTGFGELDGTAIDMCDSLYVVNTDGRIFRVRPGGQSLVWVTLPFGSFTTAAHFGSGVGDWKADHLYVMDRTGAMYEVPAGVPGKVEPHLQP